MHPEKIHKEKIHAIQLENNVDGVEGYCLSKKKPVERLPSHKLLFAQFFMIFSDGCVLKRAAQTL